MNWGRIIDRSLEAHGRGFLHSIGRIQPAAMNAWIEKHIFPGAYPPTLSEILAILEPRDFSVLDVENLRLHYALTLRHWLQRFETARERIRQMYDERFTRAWQFYLAGSMASFKTQATCSSSRCFSHGARRTQCRGPGHTFIRHSGTIPMAQANVRRAGRGRRAGRIDLRMATGACRASTSWSWTNSTSRATRYARAG